MGGRWGREGDAEEGGHAGGQLEHWLLLEQEGMGRQMLALQGWFPGGQQPIVCAGPVQLRHGVSPSRFCNDF